jgi:hypothetical protein
MFLFWAFKITSHHFDILSIRITNDFLF